MNFFDIEPIIEEHPETRIFYIIGARGVGKSYSVKRYVMRNFLEKGECFIYNKRWTTETTAGEMLNIFDDTITDPDVLESFNDYLMRKRITDHFHALHILPKAGNFYTVGQLEDGTLKWFEECSKITCVSKASKVKGNVLNLKYTSIVFDEFITDEGYFRGRKEPEQFAKIVNTVGRGNNPDLRIFMIGNPDSNIELNPYIAGSNLMIDYAHLQVNTPYFYDRVVNGRRLANNVMFIKLAPVQDDEEEHDYLNYGTLGVWNTSEEEMSASGEVKGRKFINIALLDENLIKPYYKIIMETPIIANDEFYKHIYCYYGTYRTKGRNEACVCVFAHDNKRFAERVRAANTLYSRINELDLRERKYRDMYRFNLPKEERFALLHRLIDGVRVNRYIFTDRNETANVYEQIALQSE